jgi:hypothetical protein
MNSITQKLELSNSIVGGNRARKWTPTQQPSEMSRPPPKGTRLRAPSETNRYSTGDSFLAKLDNSTLLLNLLLLLLLPNYTRRKQNTQTETFWNLRSSLLINVCPFSYKGTSIYRAP